MEIEAIKEILRLVNRSNLDEVEIEKKDFKIRIRKNSGSESVVYSTIPVQQPVAQIPPVAPVAAPPAQEAKAPAPEPKKEETAPAESSKTVTIKSPMIGTFYRSPNPDSPPFVEVGDRISVGQTLCVIEAMKLFNEIDSEINGTIVKVLVDNASPVEYDTPLFLVEPA